MPAPRAGWVDALRACEGSRQSFERMRLAGLSAVHVPVACHGGFRPAVDRLIAWNERFRANADLILPCRSADHMIKALASARTAVILGLANPLPIEDDPGLVIVLRELGIRVMRLTSDHQSLLGGGWREATDGGLTHMGRAVIAEMNDLGMLIDLSGAGERTALEAIEASSRPVAITHGARSGGRVVPDTVLRALGRSGGMFGLSLHPDDLPDGSDSTLAAFQGMAARTADIVGVARLGIGSGLGLGRSDEAPPWARRDPKVQPPPAPVQPAWFKDSHDFPSLADGLRAAGFGPAEVEAILGTNWQRFFRAAFRQGAEGAP